MGTEPGTVEWAPELPVFRAPFAPADEALVAEFLGESGLPEEAERRIDAEATRLIRHIREAGGAVGALEDFLHEYGLSTREGLALMVLAEALLRVPDAATADRLIEEKLGEAHWSERPHRSDTWLVSLSTWALGVGSRIVAPHDVPEDILHGLVKRLGGPAVRTAARRAMRVLGHHFVLGETIEEALGRARPEVARGYRFSFDMLGEGARTMADAGRYFEAYERAIDAIGAAAGDTPLPARHGISVKLSALHPRFEPLQRERVLRELAPRLLELARRARRHDLSFTVDAEEADRLELSLEVIGRVAADPTLAGWDGYGLAVQAYQKRAPAVVAWVGELAERLDRRFMVRLVKGAYWDTEIKRAQERGLDDYPVFTRKAATDLCYLVCAKRLLALRPRIFPQFATHNALTVATIAELAGPDTTDYEFQRLHGMGEALYEAVSERGRRLPCRIYAPVGGHRDLLAYLVRRLLENGANSSFVAVVRDRSVPVESLLVRPARLIGSPREARHPKIRLPLDIYAPERRNSRGVEFGERASLERLLASAAFDRPATVEARPLVGGRLLDGPPRPVTSPIDGTRVGEVRDTREADIGRIFDEARRGFEAWRRVPAEKRAAILRRAADLLEERRGHFIRLCTLEAGKTLVDGVAEVREAVDFLRYYAARAEELFAAPRAMPGPTGEENLHGWRGHGVFVCISPWNFPLAIFTGQVSAALVAGNAVLAKPAEQTPLVAFEMVKLLHEAGVPPEALHCVPGDGRIGAALVGHPDVAGVAFTGSTETGWAINRQLAAKNAPIVPLVAETGGINAMIVDATALPEQVTDDVMTSAFRSTGQRCSALRLLCLQEDVADRMLEMIVGAAGELRVGDPREPATDMGPVIDAEAKQRLLDAIGRSRARARTVLARPVPEGLPAAGHWLAPHIFELDDAAALREEIFGPVLHVVRWRTDRLEQLLDAIRGTGYGLTLGIHTRIQKTIDRIVDRLPVGNVYVNRNMIGAVVGTQPFGGSGLSGTGFKAGGPAYLTRFAQEQVVSTNTAASGGNATLLVEAGDIW
jgi:RHH-type proline utilization regulon transcriptional repressor/proline dehydrogenase/delta 1-pyrroline-5-carboxylate dehydrogenase